MSPRKPGQVGLSQEQIVQAAIELIDQVGLAGHSMRALATRLGVDASTLYYHVPSKSALAILIVDAVMADIDLASDDPALSGAERLTRAAWVYRRALMKHQRALPLVAAQSLRTPTQLAAAEVMLGILFDTGFSVVEAMVALDAVGQTVIGMCSIQAAHTEAEAASPETPYGVLPPDRFPHVHRMLAEGNDLGFEAAFEATIGALIEGLLARQTAGTLLSPHSAPAQSDLAGQGAQPRC